VFAGHHPEILPAHYQTANEKLRISKVFAEGSNGVSSAVGKNTEQAPKENRFPRQSSPRSYLVTQPRNDVGNLIPEILRTAGSRLTNPHSKTSPTLRVGSAPQKKTN
jgi:hypothetical protein